MLTKIPKGMKDVLPAESARWRAVEKECRQAALLAGYREFRTPVLEHTELLARAAGESSDVVRKEMYTFKDKGDRSVTLKPESTAGTVRAFLESGLYAQALPMKMYYINAPHFRYEAPQSGRLREHQRGTGARYTRSRPPVELAYTEAAADRAAAQRREAAIKKLPRTEKLKLIEKGEIV